ncbi:MAG: hypothetical protein ACE15C_21885, partial [Phycisphaerae bacterium]
MNDYYGRVLTDACHRLELHVSAEVAVVGAGNNELTCSTCMPPLSSVEMGGHAVEHRPPRRRQPRRHLGDDGLHRLVQLLRRRPKLLRC